MIHLARALKLIIIGIFFLMFSGCYTPQHKTELKIKGSQSLQKAFSGLKTQYDLFMKGSVKLAISGGGSTLGLEALKSGDVDIALCSSELLGDSLLGDAYQKQVVAYDALVLAVNPQNVIKRLTDREVQAIFSGTVDSWFDLGGTQTPIAAFGRDANSGSQEYFTHHFGLTADEMNVQRMESHDEMIRYISGTPGGIGFFGMGYYNTSVTGIEVYNEVKGEFVEPTYYQVANMVYPLTRPLLVYYRNDPGEEVEAFMDFVMSREGQTQISLSGLIPASVLE